MLLFFHEVIQTSRLRWCTGSHLESTWSSSNPVSGPREDIPVVVALGNHVQHPSVLELECVAPPCLAGILTLCPEARPSSFGAPESMPSDGERIRL